MESICNSIITLLGMVLIALFNIRENKKNRDQEREDRKKEREDERKRWKDEMGYDWRKFKYNETKIFYMKILRVIEIIEIDYSQEVELKRTLDEKEGEALKSKWDKETKDLHHEINLFASIEIKDLHKEILQFYYDGIDKKEKYNDSKIEDIKKKQEKLANLMKKSLNDDSLSS